MRFLVLAALLLGCGSSSEKDPAANDDGGAIDPPAPTCSPAAGGGSADVAEPTLAASLEDSWHEGGLASPSSLRPGSWSESRTPSVRDYALARSRTMASR